MSNTNRHYPWLLTHLPSTIRKNCTVSEVILPGYNPPMEQPTSDGRSKYLCRSLPTGGAVHPIALNPAKILAILAALYICSTSPAPLYRYTSSVFGFNHRDKCAILQRRTALYWKKKKKKKVNKCLIDRIYRWTTHTMTQ